MSGIQVHEVNLWLQVLCDMIMVFFIVYPNNADLQMWCNVLLWPPIILYLQLLASSSLLRLFGQQSHHTSEKI